MRWTELMQQQDAFAAAIRKEDGISFVGDPYVKGFRNRIDSNIIHLYFDDGDSVLITQPTCRVRLSRLSVMGGTAMEIAVQFASCTQRICPGIAGI